jgi:hypothetical protein
MFSWSDNGGKPGSNHFCAEPHGHKGDHKCASCDATHNGALPLEAATAAVFTTGNPAVDAAIDRLLDLPADVKAPEVADRAADLLEAIGTAPARELAKKLRDARCDGDRVMGLLDELEKINSDEAARAILDGATVAVLNAAALS